MKYLSLILLLITLFDVDVSWSQVAGNYPPVHRYSKAITGWATGCVVQRGYIRADDKEAGLASFGKDEDATGPADNIVVSLGDGGVAILSFQEPIKNNPGPDFAVFENSFDGKYLELAFVEVSTDSIRWVRFPSVSNTQITTQTETFGTLDPDLIQNLAGRYPVLFGTPFWLEDIADSAGIDIENINFIKVIDVVGSVDPLYASYDSRGNIINDPWPTPFPQSGFDLDAVAVLDISLVGVEDLSADDISLFPVPAHDILYIKTEGSEAASVRIIDIGGRVVTGWHKLSGNPGIPLDGLVSGIYLLEIRSETSTASLFRRFIRK
ncbi:MAG: T9SS type A sorting domain-containing protein [Bacteroidales bacterium]